MTPSLINATKVRTTKYAQNMAAAIIHGGIAHRTTKNALTVEGCVEYWPTSALKGKRYETRKLKKRK